MKKNTTLKVSKMVKLPEKLIQDIASLIGDGIYLANTIHDNKVDINKIALWNKAKRQTYTNCCIHVLEELDRIVPIFYDCE